MHQLFFQDLIGKVPFAYLVITLNHSLQPFSVLKYPFNLYDNLGRDKAVQDNYIKPDWFNVCNVD